MNHITKGSSSSATLSLALRSEGRLASPVTWLFRRLLFISGPPPPSFHPVTNLKIRPKTLQFTWVLWLTHGKIASCNIQKLRKYQCFCSVLSKKQCKYRGFCYQKQKNIVNTVVLGFEAQKISLFMVFCCSEISKKKRLFSATTRLRKKAAGVTTTTTTTTVTVTVPWFLACEAPKTWKFAVFFVPKFFFKLLNTAKMTPCGALRASPTSSTT